MNQKFAVRDLVLISLFTALTAIMAYIVIPMPGGLPPITGQSFAVMLAGLLLGAHKGAMSQIIYVLLGMAGMPVFAGGTAGAGVLAGPTGGFIWGFILGAFVIGKIAEMSKQRSLPVLYLAAVLGGIVAVYTPGILQMARFLDMPVYNGVVAMLPFIPGDLVKVAVAGPLALRILGSLPAAYTTTTAKPNTQ
ncbi:biotin transporter BioY [Dethiobacter alkaliphilus]|uniref:Biotin transporter n=1 Tax=Dethiobacter alkaliphilus AHT 1 TaxID=555088 RepID=C0GKK3_DETAL|nr:biotin transporter BioY [Dethiobacter alkaliphilus]EEG76170.1 BioY protein [Dethiobacter alkaliphilus AHT 1]